MAAEQIKVGTLCVLFVLIPAIGAAQYNTVSITGLIRDQQSGAVAGAGVVAVHTVTGLVVERNSDANGRFFMPELPIGTYILTSRNSRSRRRCIRRNSAARLPEVPLLA